MQAQNTRRDPVYFLAAMVEAAVLIAAAVVLNLVVIWRLPNGGSFTAGSMLPLILIGLRRGPKWGFAGCFVYGILNLLLDGFYGFHILALLLDYFLAFAVLGISGFFRGKSWGVWAAIPTAIFARFLCHFVSGGTIWAEYTPEGWNTWIYSAAYNGSYLGLELILILAVAVALRFAWPRLLTVKKYF